MSVIPRVNVPQPNRLRVRSEVFDKPELNSEYDSLRSLLEALRRFVVIREVGGIDHFVEGGTMKGNPHNLEMFGSEDTGYTLYVRPKDWAPQRDLMYRVADVDLIK